MRIQDLRSEVINGRKRVAATIIWEDADRPTHELYFETDEEFSSGLSCNPHAFLVGSIIPAMYHGEKRLAIDAEICPELRAGLVTAMSWLRNWYYEPGRELVRIEAGTRSSTPKPRTPDRAGLFFSGGVDSFTALRVNRLGFPEEHPGSIRDGVLVFGLEIDDPEMFRHVLEYYENVSRKAGITLVPIYTNLYLSYRAEDAKRDFSFWSQQLQGAAFASIAHALAGRYTVMTIAASDAIHDVTILGLQSLEPYGTHPLLDPLYSSSDLRIRHDGIELSRLEKIRLIAGWDVALQNLRVCNQFRQYRPGRLNCGRCEKCVRTMLELLATGALDKTIVFPSQNVSADLVRGTSKWWSPVWRGYDEKASYIELLGPLTKIKRNDLVIAIKKQLAMSQSLRGLKKNFSTFKKSKLGDQLYRLKVALSSSKSRSGL